MGLARQQGGIQLCGGLRLDEEDPFLLCGAPPLEMADVQGLVQGLLPCGVFGLRFRQHDEGGIVDQGGKGLLDLGLGDVDGENGFGSPQKVQQHLDTAQNGAGMAEGGAVSREGTAGIVGGVHHHPADLAHQGGEPAPKEIPAPKIVDAQGLDGGQKLFRRQLLQALAFRLPHGNGGEVGDFTVPLHGNVMHAVLFKHARHSAGDGAVNGGAVPKGGHQAPRRHLLALADRQGISLLGVSQGQHHLGNVR